MSQDVEVVFDRPIKKKRAMPKEPWGDRLPSWLYEGNEATVTSELGVASLTSFFGPGDPASSDAERARRAFGGGAPAAPSGRWFDAASGLATARALLRFARETPGRVAGPRHWGAHAAENLIPDLEGLEQTLAVAEGEGVRFHLRA